MSNTDILKEKLIALKNPSLGHDKLLQSILAYNRVIFLD